MRPALIDETREMGEDCLMLSVYVPAENSPSLYPVMFFIHGGGFTMGDAPFYGPSKLVVDGQVIVVTIQYRLGQFGFFYSDDGVLPGNQGLWDQNLALRWVKDNIRAFGGDPDLVTVFGESAGSMSAGLQMMSPYSKGLMKRAILESGSPQIISLITAYVKSFDVLKLTAEVFECQGESNAELLQCLQKVPADEFFNKTLHLARPTSSGSLFFPMVDGTFIPRDLKELAMDEQYVQENGIGDIDVIVGVNNREGSLLLITLQFSGQPMEALSSLDYFRAIMDQCFFLSGIPKADDVLKKTVEFFYRGADLDRNQTMNRDTVADLYGDCLMVAPVFEWTRYLADSPHTSNRYLYVMDHPFDFNNQGPYPGAHHGDELVMLFDYNTQIQYSNFMKMFNKTALTPGELPVGDTFVQIVTTFAKTGNPSAPLIDDLGGEWPQFTSDDEAYLSFSRSPRVVYNAGPYRKRAALWNKLIPQLNTLVSQREQDTDSKGQQPGKDEL
ncbi:hypothetical protein V1264_018565 [Littorina saxatilis]